MKTTIKIHPNTKLDIITHDDHPSFDDIVSGEYDKSQTNMFFDFEKAADELLESFEDRSCVTFLEALHNATARKIVEHWRRWSPERLEEERYKKYLK